MIVSTERYADTRKSTSDSTMTKSVGCGFFDQKSAEKSNRNVSQAKYPFEVRFMKRKPERELRIGIAMKKQRPRKTKTNPTRA